MDFQLRHVRSFSGHGRVRHDNWVVRGCMALQKWAHPYGWMFKGTSFGPPRKDSVWTPSIGKGVWTWIIPQDFHEGVLFVDQRSTMFLLWQKPLPKTRKVQELPSRNRVFLLSLPAVPTSTLPKTNSKRSWKIMVGRPSVPFELVPFQRGTASFREGRSNRFEARKDDKNPGLTENYSSNFTRSYLRSLNST